MSDLDQASLVQHLKNVLNLGKPVFVAAGATVSAGTNRVFTCYMPLNGSSVTRLVSEIGEHVSSDGTATGGGVTLWDSREYRGRFTEITNTSGIGVAYYAP